MLDVVLSQVHGAGGHRLPRRDPALWLHFHRDVSVSFPGQSGFCVRSCRPTLSSSARYFIFTSFWAYKIYYVYGFMMLVLVILCIVTVCVTIVCTYFLLNAEDYRW